MSGFPTPRHAVSIARTELVVGWRRFVGRGLVQHAAVGVAILFGLGMTGFAAIGGYGAGSSVAAGQIDDPLGLARYFPAALVVGATLLVTWLTVVRLGDVEIRDGLLTTVPHRDVVGALYLVSFVRGVGIFLPPLLFGTVAFAVGAGSAPLGVTAVLAIVTSLAVAHALGFALGLGAKYLLSRSVLFERFKLVLGAALFLAYMAAVTTNTLGTALLPAVEALRGPPVGWLADLALLPVVPAADPIAGAAALALAGVVVLGSLRASVAVAGRQWYSDPVTSGTGRTVASATGAGRMAGLVGRRSAWVARKSWLRARRAPLKLVFVVYPLFALVPLIQDTIVTGQVSPILPGTVALYAAWAVGAAFTLNPLGDEGAMLPVALTSGLTGREYVRGLLAADLVPGLPIAAAATAAVALLSPLGAVASVATVAGAVALAPGTAAIAVGVGTAFPKFDTANVTRSREVVVPSTWGFIAYSAAVLVLGAPATALQVPFVASAVADVVGVGEPVIRVAGVALGAALVGAAGWFSSRFAARHFDDYTV